MADSESVQEFTNESLNAKAAESGPVESEAVDDAPAEEPQQGADPASDYQHLLEEKFGGDVSKAMKSLAHLEAKLDDMGAEVGAARKAQAAAEEALYQAQQLDEQWDNYVEPTEDEIYENPGEAAARAYNAGDQAGLKKAWTAWAEEEPGKAAAWLTTKQVSESEARMQQALQEHLAPIEQQSQAQIFQDAYAELSRKHPGFDEFYNSPDAEQAMKAMPQSLQQATLDVCRSRDKSAIVSALEYVYGASKGVLGEAPSPSLGNRASGQEAAVLGQELGVPSGSQPAMSEVEQFHAQIRSQVTGDDSLPEESAYVTATNELRASRNLQY